ncbi:MAG TPA: DNA polymerase III subunit gamma/tau, partial [Kofleriaceae bacterium]|nr:DNA polymerase III subunit gamma/tau [Kofleriaceae bacterium]
SYQVLARKWRPQGFDDVSGQEHVTTALRNAIATGRVPHAVLLCGPRGVGKTTLARILGKALDCERGPTAEPCGVCSACTTITDGSAVDYFEMDGASNRGIDAVRELTDAVRYQPAVLRKKVYVIDEVHMLTTEAFNALLKTLEEPPPHVTFVMATTEPHKVPNTVLSRCQRYDFKLVPTPRLTAHLQRIFADEQLAVDAGAIGLIVRESGGSVRDALSLSDQVISYVGPKAISELDVAEVLGVADRALTRTIVVSLADGDAGAALVAVDAAVARGVDEVQISRAVVRFLRDLAATQVSSGQHSLVDGSAEEQADFAELAGHYDRSRIVQMFDRMIRAADELSRLPQPRLVLDLALIDVATVEPLIPMGDLIERLTRMERGLPPPPSPPRSPTPQSSPPPRNGSTGKASAAPAPAPAPAPEARKDPATATVTATATATPTATPTARPTAARGTGQIEEWESIIVALGQESERLPLVRLYENAKVLAWTEEGIEMGYPASNFDAEDVAKAQNVTAMEAFLTQHLGRPTRFQVKLLDERDLAKAPQARSAVEYKQEQQDRDRTQREAEAREHPVTRMVLDTFGATIKEIKTDV